MTLLLPATPAHPQGCNQCREAIGQAPTRTRQAYRRAIAVLILAGSGVFATAVFAIRRYNS